MTVSVSVTQPVLTALLAASGPGLLVGFRQGSEVVVASVAYCDLEELAEVEGKQQEDVGKVQRALGPDTLVAVPAHIAAAGTSKTLDCYIGGSQRSTPATVLPSNGSQAPQGRVVAEALASRFVPVRCSADLVLQVPVPVGSSAQPPASGAVAAAFDKLKQQICGPRSVYLAAAPCGAAQGRGAGWRLPGHDTLEALGASWAQPLSLTPFCSSSTGGSGGDSGAACCAPTLRFQPSPTGIACAALHVDVLCYAPGGMPAQQAVEERETERQGSVGPLRALHFLPPGLGTHITLVYPLPTPSIEDDEEALLSIRSRLHQLLGLPTNRPLLRVANALDFDSLSAAQAAAAAGPESSGVLAAAAGGVGGKPRLADVHLGLPASGVGGSVHLMQGTYDYYHYMQDKFDDSGWGCAYRSLQTICSWFSKQHYTSRGVPSHRDIQQALVSIGDKQQGFIGSRQWIGAIELGFVLDTLLGVQCKVITVASGAEMPSKAREIAHHFDTQGTPIMIGGGVLAYTLLGIDFNERTGDCAFLILDPHYTGPEDLKQIQAGQWVAWKKLGDKAAAGGDLFVKDAFYNLLCPQRPNTV
ncbi:hypothetical protein N2152v2_002608 [Parachlorella kessleri]